MKKRERGSAFSCDFSANGARYFENDFEDYGREAYKPNLRINKIIF